MCKFLYTAYVASVMICDCIRDQGDNPGFFHNQVIYPF